MQKICLSLIGLCLCCSLASEAQPTAKKKKVPKKQTVQPVAPENPPPKEEDLKVEMQEASAPPPPPKEEIYTIAEDVPSSAADVMASFPGGDKALDAFIAQKLRYPNAARKQSVTGEVVVNYTIDRNGMVKNIIIEKSLGYGCDEEARRVMNMMPNWSPAKRYSYAIEMSFTKSIAFSPALPSPDKADEWLIQKNADAQFGFAPDAWSKYLKKELRYPAGISPKKINGDVILRCKVSRMGKIEEVQLVAGMGDDFDNEALRLMRNCPNWNPAIVNYQAVDRYQDMVIHFGKE